MIWLHIIFIFRAITSGKDPYLLLIQKYKRFDTTDAQSQVSDYRLKLLEECAGMLMVQVAFFLKEGLDSLMPCFCVGVFESTGWESVCLGQ